MIPGLFVLSLILRVMDSPMTLSELILSELMVGSFGVSDPVTGEGSASDSDFSPTENPGFYESRNQ
jgi:hypothetical protein